MARTLGKFVSLRDVRIRFIREKEVTRHDGNIARILLWEVTCPRCAAWWEVCQLRAQRDEAGPPEFHLGRFIERGVRRCPACRVAVREERRATRDGLAAPREATAPRS